MSQRAKQATLSTTLIEFSVPDFEVIKDFYGRLDFTVVWEEKPKGLNGYLVMKMQKNVLCFFCGNEHVFEHPFFKTFPKNTKRGYGVEVGFPVDRIDEFYNRIIRKIDKKYVFQPLRLQPWGLKDFRLRDPNGYFIRFAEPADFLSEMKLNDKNYLS